MMGNMFMYAKGKKIMDVNDNEILLKGVGLGGWLLPEGYMWGNHKYYERPRRFEERILELVGAEDAATFWETYYKTFISDQDFELIKKHGYNSIRLPLHFRLLMVENETDNQVDFIEYGFTIIDYVIAQCKKHDLYVILDLHSAPGGQTGANIDDSKYDKPELFTKRIYQEQTIQLWEEIARRYKDEPIVGMYDLLNEPLPKHHSDLYGKLMPLYKEIISAIRAIDSKHMLSIEGANWATDFSILTEKLDDNMIIHFHKYWNSPSIESIQTFLDKRAQFNQPLYMGEGGENDPYWYGGAFKLYDQLDISWNFWTYKKIENSNSIISFDKPTDWLTLFDPDITVSKVTAKRLLNEFLDCIKFENCKANMTVTNHLLRKDQFMTPSGFYDYQGKNVSFCTSHNERGAIRGNDMTNIVNKDGDPFIYHFNRLTELQKTDEKYPYLFMYQGDFYHYTFHLSNKNETSIEITDNGAVYDLFINGLLVEGIKEIGSTTFRFNGVMGKNVLKIVCVAPGIVKQIRVN